MSICVGGKNTFSSKAKAILIAFPNIE